MSEDEKVARINAAGLKHLMTLLQAIEDESLDEEAFLAKTYSSLIVAKLLGFSPSALAKDAEAAAQRLLDLTAEEDK